MAGRKLLLSSQQRTPNTDLLLLLRNEANSLAEIGETAAAIGKFRESLSLDNDSGGDSDADQFANLLASALSSTQRSAGNIAFEFEKICRLALLLNAKKTAQARLIDDTLEELASDLAQLLGKVFDLGVAYQIAANMQGFGIDDRTLAWLERRFTPDT